MARGEGSSYGVCAERVTVSMSEGLRRVVFLQAG